MTTREKSPVRKLNLSKQIIAKLSNGKLSLKHPHLNQHRNPTDIPATYTCRACASFDNTCGSAGC